MESGTATDWQACIGRDWLNIPEVLSLDAEQFSQLGECGISLPQEAQVENTYLVRFGPDLDVNEIPIKDPDRALACELVFSTWIRRRDAHAFNRVYKFGVPIFYDFGTAFLGEPKIIDLNRFFGPPRNSGWAGCWRITQGTALDLDTRRLRDLEEARFRNEGRQGAVSHTQPGAFFCGTGELQEGDWAHG